MKPTVEQNNLSKRAEVAQRNAAAFPSIVDECSHLFVTPRVIPVSKASLVEQLSCHELEAAFAIERLARAILVIPDFPRADGRFRCFEELNWNGEVDPTAL